MNEPEQSTVQPPDEAHEAPRAKRDGVSRSPMAFVRLGVVLVAFVARLILIAPLVAILLFLLWAVIQF